MSTRSRMQAIVGLGVDLTDTSWQWWIDARQVADGFAIVFYDGERGESHELLRMAEPYSWRRFGEVLCSWQRHGNAVSGTLDVSWLPGLEPRLITVAGESGVIAAILRFCLANGESSTARWLLRQSDESLAALNEVLPLRQVLSTSGLDSRREILEEIVDSIDELNLPIDLLMLCANYGVPRPDSGLFTLRAHLASNMARLLEVQDSRVDTFRAQIDAMVATFDDMPTRGGGVTWPSPRTRAIRYLDEYVGRHNSLATGVHEVP